MANRDTFNWGNIEPDIPIEMTLIFSRTKKDNGVSEKDGEPFNWHRYPVKIAGEELTMFTPNEAVHKLLQEMGVNNKGDEFSITKKVGYNKATKKPTIFYEVGFNGEEKNTSSLVKETLKPKEETSEEEPEPDDLEQDFRSIAVPIWDVALDWIGQGTDLAAEHLLSLKTEIVKGCSSMVNTQAIQRNGKGKTR